MANNLKDHLKEVADAIRAKKGTTDLINPQDFATEIEGITSGSGGGESSGDWHYFDVSTSDILLKAQIFVIAQNLKLSGTQTSATLRGGAIYPAGAMLTLPIPDSEIVAISVDYSVEVVAGGMKMKIEDSVSSSPWYGQIPEITKEQFYDLNA